MKILSAQRNPYSPGLIEVTVEDHEVPFYATLQNPASWLDRALAAWVAAGNRITDPVRD